MKIIIDFNYATLHNVQMLSLWKEIALQFYRAVNNRRS